MPSDPEEYRANARRCGEMATESIDPKLKQTFLELAEAWTALANKVDKSRALIERSSCEP
jgi:hypothetical protein